MMREQIREKLRTAFDLLYLDVQDESYRHNVPAGSESHFRVIIVSDSFAHQRFLVRHRAVYSALTDELAGSVHALSLHTYTVKEWQQLQNTLPDSPHCRGGG